MKRKSERSIFIIVCVSNVRIARMVQMGQVLLNLRLRLSLSRAVHQHESLLLTKASVPCALFNRVPLVAAKFASLEKLGPLLQRVARLHVVRKAG